MALSVSKGSMPAMSNKREGDMTSEDLVQCLLDIASWLEDKCGAVGADYANTPPASPDGLAQLPAAAPDVLKGMLAAHDGRLPIYDFFSLSCAQVHVLLTFT
jgi:hypothetical protein